MLQLSNNGILPQNPLIVAHANIFTDSYHLLKLKKKIL